jgi:hypothetical protein
VAGKAYRRDAGAYRLRDELDCFVHAWAFLFV